MRFFLIRHGETVHNVAGVYAGITDSALTNHGVLQAGRLGAHLAATDVKVSHIFSSDLQRAANTAEAIRVAQSPPTQAVMQLRLLREQDFGFYEGKTFSQRPRDPSGRDAHLDAHRNDPGFRDVESKESMMVRADTFVDVHLLPLFAVVRDEHSIVVVAHGIILNYLWRSILKRFPPANVAVATSADRGVGLDYIGAWSNTGVLDLEIKLRPGIIPGQEKATYGPPLEAPPPILSSTEAGPSELSQQSTAVPPATIATPVSRPMLPHMSLVVKAVNSLEHLNGLKKTRGGIGSLKHDPSQKTMDSFFKKRTD
ncbi:putative phosphatase [Lachnellula arida]|uniref:Putative phosphatase n=1 Tax=Lachnellula arida TaxID=1316785 RepID=A0A8T9BAP1_9HELO|nr:putative phosphatase [Lachnellula arida]